MIWDILEIEMTDDLDIIKKAYAKILVTCHPEEKPLEFQELQQAYQVAIAYAKRVKARSRIKEDQKWQEGQWQAEQDLYIGTYKKEQVGESNPQNIEKLNENDIPDYIKNIDKLAETAFEASKKQEQKEYMKKVFHLFEQENKMIDFTATEALLTSDVFREIALQEEFAKHLKKLIGYGNYQHIKLILILHKEYSNLHQEYHDNKVVAEMDEFFTYIKKSHRDVITAKIKKYFCLASVICIVVIIGFNAYTHSDRYLLRNSPNSLYVAEQVKQRYGIDIAPVDIQIETTDNTYFSNKSGLNRVRNYMMEYKIDDTILKWQGLFTMNMENKNEIAFNLEQEIMNYYIQQNLEKYKDTGGTLINSETSTGLVYEPNFFHYDQQTIHKQFYLQVDITEVESFLDSLSEFITDLFSDPVVLLRDTTYQFTIYFYYPDTNNFLLDIPKETIITLSTTNQEIDFETLRNQWIKSVEESEELNYGNRGD